MSKNVRQIWFQYKNNFHCLSGLIGNVVLWFPVLHNFIKKSLNSGSAQIQAQPATCWRW